MPESAEEMYARVVGLLGEGGRPPPPPTASWRTFPFEGEMLVRPLEQPVAAEPERHGADPAECWCTADPDRGAIWRDTTWRVAAPPAPTGLPLQLFLTPREHLDVTEMDAGLASSFGVMTSRLVRVMSALPHVGRVHFSQWGDGSTHLHVWFFARTARVRQTMGTFAAVWDDLLPPVPDDVWRADLRTVAAGLAAHGGTALV